MSVDEVVSIVSTSGAGDMLEFRAEPWTFEERGYEGPTVHVELRCGDLRAIARLPNYVADAERLAPMFRDIDRDWRGWEGEKWAGNPDRDWLAVSATHDTQGHVQLEVHLKDGWPLEATWQVRATISIDVGSAGALALALEAWQRRVWPEEKRWRLPAS